MYVTLLERAGSLLLNKRQILTAGGLLAGCHWSKPRGTFNAELDIVLVPPFWEFFLFSGSAASLDLHPNSDRAVLVTYRSPGTYQTSRASAAAGRVRAVPLRLSSGTGMCRTPRAAPTTLHPQTSLQEDRLLAVCL